MNKQQLDYVVEESWRWAIACESQPEAPAALQRLSAYRDLSSTCPTGKHTSQEHTHVLGLCTVFIGASMGFAAFCVDVLLEKLNNWKFGAVVAVIRTRGGFWLPYLTLLAFCLGYCALAGAIPSYIAPLSAGSGIPEIKAYLNGVRIRGAPFPAVLCYSSCLAPACLLFAIKPANWALHSAAAS